MKSFKLNETESTLRVSLEAPGSELAPVFDTLVTIPGFSGISVSNRASVRVPPESRSEVLSLLAKAGFTMLVLALLMLPGKAFAFCDDWRTSDTVLEIGFIAADFIAGYESARVQRKGGWESNPTLGRHPSDAAFLQYDIALAGLHGLVSCWLPRTSRIWFQSVTLVIQAVDAAHDARVAGNLTIAF